MVLDGLRVLAVDDDEDSAELYRVVLGNLRADVRVARSGEAALAELGPSWVPHILLTHRRLPDMRGADLAAAVHRQAGAAVGLICTTTDTRSSVHEEARAEGFSACLAKPFELDALITAVAEAGKAVAGRQ